MGIEIKGEAVSESTELVKKLLVDYFGIEPVVAIKLAIKTTENHFSKLKESCFLVAEFPYVDKVYRDSFYSYYSTKQTMYLRDTIRISIFIHEIDNYDLGNIEKLSAIKKAYAGFLILRPTPPNIIGRSLISPSALKNNNFHICSTFIPSTVFGLKLNISGFPHSSQDAETMTCAETTLWALMEYFGNKYPDYKPILPSKIIQVLNQKSFERQIPSNGLNIEQLSFALKEFGFGTRIYSKTEFEELEFKRIFSIYIESGIPLIVSLEDESASVGHACICIGHEKIINTSIEELIPYKAKADKAPKKDKVGKKDKVKEEDELDKLIRLKGITLFDWNDLKKEYIFIDDNHSCYQKASFDSPTIHYPDVSWHNYKINHFVAPLYPKIYLEAYEAKNYILHFILLVPNIIQNYSNLLIRFFLASSRSYKDAIILNNEMSIEAKDLILETPLPKFLWVAEISNKELIKKDLADGLILLDATEANISYNKPLIMCLKHNKYRTSSNLEGIDINLQPYKIYRGNLKNL